MSETESESRSSCSSRQSSYSSKSFHSDEKASHSDEKIQKPTKKKNVQQNKGTLYSSVMCLLFSFY